MSTVIDVTALGSAGFVIQGSGYSGTGSIVSSAGDINGDGFDDVIIGAPNTPNYYSGTSYVVFGHDGGFATVDLADLDSSTGFAIHGAPGDYSGSSVSDAGDINGDGFDDLVIGGSSGYYNFSNGNVYVLYGRESGPATIDLGNLSATDGFTIADTSGFYYGNTHTVSAAGDVNGDGLGDIAITSSDGQSFVVFGSDSGFGAIDLANFDSSAGFVVQSDSPGVLSAAGDVNGDGIDDVIIGAQWGDSGSAYVIFGHEGAFATIDVTNLTSSEGFAITSATGSPGPYATTAGDFNGDGLGDLIIGSPNLHVNGVVTGGAYIVFGQTSGATVDLDNLSASSGILIQGDFIGYSISAAGDVNADGYDDVILGAPGANGSAGRAYVIYGTPGTPGTIDLTALAPSDGFVIEGQAAYDSLGASVSAAGDLNGDGFDDVIVGAPGTDVGDGTYAGAAYVIFGAASPPRHITGTDSGETLTGASGNDYIDALGGADILYGLRGDDLLYGGAGNDRLDGGAGIDKMYGGLGDDLYIVRDSTDYAYEDAGEGTDRVISSIDYRLPENVENLSLSGTADLIGKGNGLDNAITGNSGNNALYGYGGDDKLLGGAGNDRLDGGTGIDRLYGQEGNDVYVVNNSTTYVYEGVGEGTDRVYSTVSLALRANVEELVLTGSSAIDGYGNDLANRILGNDSANTINGGAGDDRLFGGGGNDAINGGDGNDFIEGGAGQDIVYGAAGADTFEFRDGDFGGATTATADIIHDFVNGTDRIRLDAVDANTLLDGNQAFAFIGTDAFGSTAGELRYEQISGATYLSGDTDGDGSADFMIRIDGLHTLASGDLIL